MSSKSKHKKEPLIKLSRREDIDPENGIVRAERLSRACIKVLKTEQLGHEVRFIRGSTGEIALPYDTAATVTYKCLPKPLSLPGDVSELPEHTHGLIVSYVVAKERMAGDTSTQRGANIYLTMYEAAKARLRPHMGDGASYRLINRY